MSFGPNKTTTDYTSLGFGQYREFLFPYGLEVHVDSDTDVDCLDFGLDDSNIDADTKPELVNSVDPPTVADTENQEVMVAGIEQTLHMNADSITPEVELLELGEFPILH